MHVALIQMAPKGELLQENIRAIADYLPSLHECLALFPANALISFDEEPSPFRQTLRDEVPLALTELSGMVNDNTLLLLGPDSSWQSVDHPVDDPLPALYVVESESYTTLIGEKFSLGAMYYFAAEQCAVVALFSDVPRMLHDDVTEEVISKLRATGPKKCVILSALPYCMGLTEAWEEFVQNIARTLSLRVYAVSAAGAQAEKIFFGQSLIVEGNTIEARGKSFAPDVLLTSELPRKESLAAMSCEEELWNALLLGTRAFVEACRAETVYIGLSGGIDSALVLAIAVSALGCEKVCALLMPSPYTPPDSLHDAEALCDLFQVERHIIPIDSVFECYHSLLDPLFESMPKRSMDVTFENIQARIRAALLCAFANRRGGIILNTSNKSEIAMGYSTLYGDPCGAIAVIGDLTKTWVYRLARFYSETHSAKIPRSILEKAPSAELRHGQKDSDSLPEYALLDPLLEGFFEGKSPVTEEERHLCARFLGAEFKRRQEPFALMVTETPLGKAVSFPINHAYMPEATLLQEKE